MPKRIIYIFIILFCFSFIPKSLLHSEESKESKELYEALKRTGIYLKEKKKNNPDKASNIIKEKKKKEKKGKKIKDIKINENLMHKLGMYSEFVELRSNIYDSFYKEIKKAKNFLTDKYQLSKDIDIIKKCKDYYVELAEKAYEKKDYSLAYSYFTFALICEKYYNPKILDCIQKMSEQPLEEGSIVLFGRYEQDGNLENGPEPIEWIVLGTSDDKALLLSKYVLDYKPVHTFNEYYPWEQSELMDWLNNDFFDKAFKISEKRRMVKMEISFKWLSNHTDVLGFSHATLSSNESFNKMLKNMEEKGSEGIYAYVSCPDTPDLSTLYVNNDRAAYAVPALSLDISEEKLKVLNSELYEQIKAEKKLSKSNSELEKQNSLVKTKVFVPTGYWVRNTSSKKQSCIDEFGFQETKDENTVYGIRPEIMIKYESKKEKYDDEDEEDDY